MTDPIADMLTRIRNAQMVKKSVVIMPFSKLKFNILTLMAREGWIGSVKRIEPADGKADISKSKKTDTERLNRFAELQVKIKYLDDGRQPKITSLKRISKPGGRVYVDKEHIPFVLNGRGLAVISTSQGLLTDKAARKGKVGGEVICEVY